MAGAAGGVGVPLDRPKGPDGPHPVHGIAGAGGWVAAAGGRVSNGALPRVLRLRLVFFFFPWRRHEPQQSARSARTTVLLCGRHPVHAPSGRPPPTPPAAYPARRLPRSQLVERLMLRAVAPSRVYAHNWEPGDVVLADNHACWHSATGGLGPSDKRVMHLSTWDGSAPPLTG